MGVACPVLKPEYEGLVGGRVSQGLSVRRVKELISQSEPTPQLGRRLPHGAGPSVARQSSFDFSEACVLPQ